MGWIKTNDYTEAPNYFIQTEKTALKYALLYGTIYHRYHENLNKFQKEDLHLATKTLKMEQTKMDNLTNANDIADAMHQFTAGATGMVEAIIQQTREQLKEKDREIAELKRKHNIEMMLKSSYIDRYWEQLHEANEILTLLIEDIQG